MISILKALQNLDRACYDRFLLEECGVAFVSEERNRIRQVIRSFQDAFHCDNQKEIEMFTAPGRTELGGNHTDHQNGKVLAAAINLDLLACAAPNQSDTIRIVSEGYTRTEICLGSLKPEPCEKNTSAALIRGVLNGIRELGYSVAGFDAFVSSRIPPGAGLSSSAAFEVLFGVLGSRFFCGGKLSETEIARIGQRAENLYFGKPCGQMDQLASAAGGIVHIDFHEGRSNVRKITYDISQSQHRLCMIDTGSDHTGLTAEYAAVPDEMKRIAGYFQKEVLDEISDADLNRFLPELRSRCGDRAVLRAVHYFDEIKRVDQEAEALNRSDFEKFLQLVTQSGQSSFMYLQNIYTPGRPAVQPLSVALALAGRLLHGRGAVRVHGGGFAGAILAFVPDDLLSAFQTEMDRIFGAGACRGLSIRHAGGAAFVV